MQIYPNVNLDSVASHHINQIEVYVFGIPWEPKERNGDSIGIFKVSPKNSLFAVADGVGGERGGPEASKIAIEELANSIEKMKSSKSRISNIIDAFETSNKKILDLNTGAATTLIVLEINHFGFRFYNCGDSCGVVFSQDGELFFNTLAHNPIDLGKVADLIEDDVYDIDDSRRYVTNFLGKNDFSIDVVCQRKLPKDSVVIIGSDGLFDNLSLDMLSEMIKNTSSFNELACQIQKTSLERMYLGDGNDYSKPDDLSFILFQYP